MSDPSIQRGPSKEVPCIGYDATTKHAYVPLEAVSVQQDATTGQWYGVLNVNATVTPAANQRVSSLIGDFDPGSIEDLATLLTLAGAPGDANTVASLMGRLTKIRDLLLTAQINVGTPTGSVVSVGTGSTAVVTPGANAKLLILTNDSPNMIYLNISGGAAALNAGIRLNANGGSILFDRYVPSAAITAISSVAASNLLVEVG